MFLVYSVTLLCQSRQAEQRGSFSHLYSLDHGCMTLDHSSSHRLIVFSRSVMHDDLQLQCFVQQSSQELLD